MLYLIFAAAIIVIGCFCVVFSFDSKRTKKTKNRLMLAAFICLIIEMSLIYMIMNNPML